MAEKQTKIIKCLNCGKEITVEVGKRGKPRKFCNDTCRNEYYGKKRGEKARTETRKCIVCGTEFEVSPKSLKKTCSEECRKKHMNAYNSAYIKKRRLEDEEFAERSRSSSILSSSKAYAKKQWDAYRQHAEKIMMLAKMKDPEAIIARYLDENMTLRNKSVPARQYISEEEEKASRLLESLGDLLTSD